MSDLGDCNSVLVVSCGKRVRLDALLDNICGEAKESGENGRICSSTVCDASRRFEICNKYYNASICLKARTHVPTRSCEDSFEAVILSFDSDEDGSFEAVKAWFDFIAKLPRAPAVQLILDGCELETEKEMSHKTVILKWCVENGVEMIDTLVEQEDSDDDTSVDMTGYKRIYQALSAHVWPAMTRKGDTFLSNVCRDISIISCHNGASVANKDNNDSCHHGVSEEEVKANCDAASNDLSDSGSDHSIPYTQLPDHETSDASVDEIDEETFGALFENMRTMKENAASMPHHERKAYAETVVLAFWKAMNGDKDEIDGLE